MMLFGTSFEGALLAEIAFFLRSIVADVVDVSWVMTMMTVTLPLVTACLSAGIGNVRPVCWLFRMG